MRAISTVIASILMLMITIALGGTTFLFISGTFTGKTATAFEVIDSVNDTVTIRNSGTGALVSFTSVKIDGNDAVYRVSKQDSSLVGYWKMDESSWVNDCSIKTVIDSSGNDNSGKSCPASTGPIGGGTGQFGNAGSFDGSNDYVDVGNDVSLRVSPQFTVEAWVYMNQNKWHYYFGKCLYAIDSGLTLGHHSVAQQWMIYYRDSAGNYIGKYWGTQLLNQWVHLVVTYDKSLVSANWKTYQNGIPKETFNYNGNPLSDASYSASIGRDTCDTRYWSGMIDEVKIYSRVLSEQEVKAHYNIGSQIDSGETATMKVYNTLSKGTHTLRLCTSSMCNTAILTVN